MVMKLKEYIQETLGTEIFPEKLPETGQGKLPYYITATFRLFNAQLFHRPVMLAEIKNKTDFTTTQIQKQLHLIADVFNTTVVLLADQLTFINRKRLIEKRINFIVPGKQMYLPDLLVDLRETFQKKRELKETLYPSAQYILLYHILRKNDPLENHTLKQLAKKLHYTPMAITKAVADLERNGLCIAEGKKEKYIRFENNKKELWEKALPLMTSPVIKQVFTDEIPVNLALCKANASALPQYSEMAASTHTFTPIEKTLFYSLQKNDQWKNMDDREGKYCLEIWKYNPVPLTTTDFVDPLSLYLSMKDSKDERIEMALEKILNDYIFTNNDYNLW